MWYLCTCKFTQISKPHESGRVWVPPFMFSGRNTRLKYMNHSNRCNRWTLITMIIICYCWTPITMIHILEPSISSTEHKDDRSHVALIAQLVEHCTGNAKVVDSNPVQSLKFFQVIFPVVLWLHSHLSFYHYLLLLDTYYYNFHCDWTKTSQNVM